MKRTTLFLVAILVITAVVLSACGGGDGDGGGTSTRPNPPAEYTGKTNPHEGNADAATQGQTLYTANCASCHGNTGLGDGTAAAALDPKPGNLQTAASEAGDDYLFWRINEGGAMEPFNSSMPAWKGVLSEDEIWQVITYLNTL